MEQSLEAVNAVAHGTRVQCYDRQSKGPEGLSMVLGSQI